MFVKVKSVPSKIIALTVVLTCLFACWTSIDAYGAVPMNAGIDLSRELSSEKIILGDEIEITYKIIPQPIPKSAVTPPAKEIYLVMDTSSSMERDLEGNFIFPPGSRKSRKDISTEAAIKFLDNLKEKTNVKVGLISFSDAGMIKKPLTSNIDSVKQAVKNLIYSTGTNIGDGMRLAYHELKNSSADTYFILLTDGTPTYHSAEKNWPYDFYFGEGNAPRNVIGGAKDKEYCYEMAERIKEQSDIKSYMIAFTSDSDSNILEEVAQRAGGEYKNALTADALDNVYEEIYEDIIVDFSIDNVEFKESYPEGLSIVSVLDGFVVNGQTVTGNIGTIKYVYNPDTDQYEAAPVEFTIKIKGTSPGKHVLDSSELSYEIDDEKQTVEFEEKSFEVVAVSAPIAVERSLSKEEVLVDEEVVVSYTINPEEFSVDPDVKPMTQLIVKDVKFSEVFPEGLTVVSAAGFSVSGQNVTGDLGEIVYTYDPAGKKYKANPVNFEIKLKGTEGEYTLGEGGTSKIDYKDLDEGANAKTFPELELRVVKFGMPKLEVLNVVKRGEKVNVKLGVDLPDRTEYGQIRLENDEVVSLDDGAVVNISADGSYWYNGLSIYKTHKVYLWVVSDFDPDVTNQTELITIFNAIDIN